jgi:hypothetical protein
MSKMFWLSSVLASLAVTGCVLDLDDDDDDDGAGESSNSASNTASNTASASDSTASESSGAASSEGSTAAVDSSGSATGGVTGCGWGELPGQVNVEMGYTCGGEGEDPKMIFPLACPAGVELVAGGDCGGKTGVQGVGCCDGTSVWFCAESDSGPPPVLFTEECG